MSKNETNVKKPELIGASSEKFLTVGRLRFVLIKPKFSTVLNLL